MLKITKYGSSWCKPCETLQKVMDEILPAYNTNVEYESIDVEEEYELADKMNIRGVPTVIFEKDGAVVLRFMGTKSGNEIKELIDKYVN